VANVLYKGLIHYKFRYEFEMDEQTRIQLEAAAFRGFVAHLQKRSDVQNIDLMNLSGFCRECLSKWYLAAAQEHAVEMCFYRVRKLIYGMPFDQWKTKYQQKASAEQMEAFEKTKPLHAEISGHNK